MTTDPFPADTRSSGEVCVSDGPRGGVNSEGSGDKLSAVYVLDKELHSCECEWNVTLIFVNLVWLDSASMLEPSTSMLKSSLSRRYHVPGRLQASRPLR